MELNVFLGTFRHIETGETEHIIATTEERVQQALIAKMRWYLSNTDQYYAPTNPQPQIPEDYQELIDIGYCWDYYECFIEPKVVYGVEQ